MSRATQGAATMETRIDEDEQELCNAQCHPGVFYKRTYSAEDHQRKSPVDVPPDADVIEPVTREATKSKPSPKVQAVPSRPYAHTNQEMQKQT